MQVRIAPFTDEYIDMSLEELITYVINDEDGYFLDYSDPEDMCDEFLASAENYISFEDSEELENNREEVITALVNARNKINDQNYADYVQDSAQFMRDTWLEDFMDQSNYPVFGDCKEKCFKDAIKLMYSKYCVNS